MLFQNQGFLNLTGTPTMQLQATLYTIQAQYWDPIKKSNQPLPPHYWALYKPGDTTVVQCSGPSSDKGVSVMKMPNPFPDADYALAVYPIPNDARTAYTTAKEGWIDLTTNKWFIPSAISPRLDKNKLLRIPQWDSMRKATNNGGGGFIDAPAKVKDNFLKKGLLTKSDIEAYGTDATPWNMQLDYQWLRAHVRYVFVNWKDGKEENLPPGLVVQAVNDKGTVLGSGTAIDDSDGTAYMLIPTTQDKWSTLHLAFQAPKGTRVDLSSPAGTPDQRLTSTGVTPTDRTTRNTLPNAWHSYGMGAAYAATATGTPGNRKTWTDLRKDIAKDGSATEPLIVFQLDDVVLYDKNKLAKVKAGTRFTAFDHLLALRNPDTPATPHYSKGTLGSPLLNQKQVYALTGSVPAPAAPTIMRDLSTRLMVIGTSFYDFEEKRVIGTPGKTLCLGSRAAVLNDHVMVDYRMGSPYFPSNGNFGGPQIHLIEVPNVLDPKANKQLIHMLLFVSCNIKDPKNVLTAPGQSVNDLYKSLNMASERWSQGGPGVPANKDYRIVSKDPSTRNLVIRPRAFFVPVGDDAGAIDITMATGGNRSNMAGPKPGTHFLCFTIGAAKGNLEYYDSALWGVPAAPPAGAQPGDISPRTDNENDSDNVGYTWHTLTHEFGHVLGLPDEYGEELDPRTVDPTQGTQNPRIQGFSPPQQGMQSNYRPFYTDGASVMKGNKIPRLRHMRHHVEALNSDATFASLPNRPYVIRHETLGGSGIEYVRPSNEHPNPYTVQFSDQAIPSGFGMTALFPAGQDEGVAEAMFVAQGAAPTTLAAASQFSALLIVRSRVRFIFDATINAPNQLRTIRNDFINQLYDGKHRMAAGTRFAMTGDATFPRIAVILQPLCACGPSKSGEPADQFTLNFTNAAGATPPAAPAANPFAAGTITTRAINLDIAHFNVFSVLRAILGVPTATAGAGGAPNTANTAVLTVADFANIKSLLDTKLGGTHTAVPF
jgi:hypothetical protein